MQTVSDLSSKCHHAHGPATQRVITTAEWLFKPPHRSPRLGSPRALIWMGGRVRARVGVDGTAPLLSSDG
ncbi:hypothetical protein AAFF_G00138240 [Aldrovandia affinis]|uniref:Uncharacterized protein n=1 Tax=Aldrovandia affinis TaxID=143900 RepID=A0AAD7TBZ8_9TELE|nr:hypothetical protein AAFF_G00138240 [Aldrovandia affinis]